jgi:hypothetical protein
LEEVIFGEAPRIFQNFPSIARTDRQTNITVALIYKMALSTSMGSGLQCLGSLSLIPFLLACTSMSVLTMCRHETHKGTCFNIVSSRGQQVTIGKFEVVFFLNSFLNYFMKGKSTFPLAFL